MKNYIAIISDNILFSSLIGTLIKRDLPDTETIQITTFKQLNNEFDQNSFKLILIDGGMSYISSIEAVQYLRITKLVKSPIWFFPEIVADHYIQKANRIGVSRIIKKPFDPYNLFEEIKKSLSNN